MKALSRKQTNLWLVLGYALLLSAAVLYFCTKSSPGYAINDWCDANIYLTIGKGMTRGKVMYRDLYDHKGPLLYALHYVAALISFRDFFGVYLLEIVQAAFFLFFSHRIIRLYASERSAWLLTPVLAVAVYASLSFSQGDSAEEMCLPLMAAQMYLLLRRFSKDELLSRGELMTTGVLAGCVFWIKFTVVGVPAGLALGALLPLALRRQWKPAFQALGWMVVGVFLSTLPWIAYFALNNAVYDWLKVYIGHNLFLYSNTESLTLPERLQAIVVWIGSWLLQNWAYTPLVLLGPIWLSLRYRSQKAMTRAIWLALAIGALFVFISGKQYTYYGLALAVLAPLGLAALGSRLDSWLSRLSQKRGLLSGLFAGVSVLCVALCWFSPNIHPLVGAPFGAAKEDTMEYQIVAAMDDLTDDTTLLNFGFMDGGFYTAAGLVPNVKYFCQTNVPLPEMRSEQRRYVSDELCEYVVSYMIKEKLFEHYEIIAEAESPNFWYPQVSLYRLKPEYR